MAGISGSGIGSLYQIVRQAIGRLGSLETTTTRHEKEIAELKERAARAQADLERLTKVTGHQGREIEDQRRKIETLGNDITKLERATHGERIKRGKQKARADRLEATLERVRRNRR
jgi:hypothetical protein